MKFVILWTFTFSKLSIIWFISPVPTCLVHNYEVVWRFHLSDLAFIFVSWSNLLIPIIGTSLHLVVELSTMNTDKLHFVKAFLDSRAIGSFINWDFVYAKKLNTRAISHLILVFNVDSSSNEAGKVSEIIDVLLWYHSHLERILLAVSNLGKQDLILGYNWLKDHNPRIN